MFISMIIDIEWTKKGKYRHFVCTMTQKWQHFCDPPHAWTLVLPGAHVGKYVVEGEVHLVDTRYFRRQGHYRLDRSGKEDAITTSTFDNKKILIKTTSASNSPCVYNRICLSFETEQSGTCTEENGRRRAHRSRTRTVEIDHVTTANNATSSRRLDAATHRESRDSDSQSFRTGNTCQNGGKCATQVPMNLSWMETVLHFFAETLRTREFSKFESASNS